MSKKQTANSYTVTILMIAVTMTLVSLVAIMLSKAGTQVDRINKVSTVECPNEPLSQD